LNRGVGGAAGTALSPDKRRFKANGKDESEKGEDGSSHGGWTSKWGATDEAFQVRIDYHSRRRQGETARVTLAIEIFVKKGGMHLFSTVSRAQFLPNDLRISQCMKGAQSGVLGRGSGDLISQKKKKEILKAGHL